MRKISWPAFRRFLKRRLPPVIANYKWYAETAGAGESVPAGTQLRRFLAAPSFAMFRGGAVVRYAEMPVTTRCTLRCAKCANLMQYRSITKKVYL